MAKQVSPSEAKFKINIKEGIVEIEGNDTFVERHLEKFEEICKSAIQDVVARRIDNVRNTEGNIFSKTKCSATRIYDTSYITFERRRAINI